MPITTAGCFAIGLRCRRRGGSPSVLGDHHTADSLPTPSIDAQRPPKAFARRLPRARSRALALRRDPRRPNRLAFRFRPIHARFDAFPNQFQFKHPKAGEQIQQQPTSSCGRIKAFLGACAQKPDVQRVPHGERIVHVLDRPQGPVQFEHQHGVKPMLNGVIVQAFSSRPSHQVVGAGLV